jgi:Cu/Zn superoxide dismutase
MQMRIQHPVRASVIVATISISSTLIACSGNYSDNSTSYQPPADSAAIASLRGISDSDSALNGTVRFRQTGDSVQVTAAIQGLKPGKAYAVDVRENGACVNLQAGGNGSTLGGGSNAGDTLSSHGGDSLPHLQVGAAGIGQLSTTTLAFSLNPVDTNFIIGRSLVISETKADSGIQTGPGTGTGGNSGNAIACGVINGTSVADTTGGQVDTTTHGNGTGTGTTGTGTTGVIPGNTEMPDKNG